MTTHHTDEKKPARGGRLQAQHLATASAGCAEAELDVQIAKVVFGLDSTVIQAWPWGIPPFSTERNWAAAVVGRMLAHQAVSEFDAELERRALLWGWKNDEKKNIPALILVLTPDEICNAALDAIQQFHCGE